MSAGLFPLCYSTQPALQYHTFRVTHGAAARMRQDRVSCVEGPAWCPATAVPMPPSPGMGHLFCTPLLSAASGKVSKPNGVISDSLLFFESVVQGVLFAPQRRAAPHLGRGGSERRPGPSPRDEDLRGEERDARNAGTGSRPAPPPPQSARPSLHSPPAGQCQGERRGECAPQNRPGPYPCNPTGKRASLQDTAEQPMEPIL